MHSPAGEGNHTQRTTESRRRRIGYRCSALVPIYFGPPTPNPVTMQLAALLRINSLIHHDGSPTHPHPHSLGSTIDASRTTPRGSNTAESPSALPKSLTIILSLCRYTRLVLVLLRSFFGPAIFLKNRYSNYHQSTRTRSSAQQQDIIGTTSRFKLRSVHDTE